MELFDDIFEFSKAVSKKMLSCERTSKKFQKNGKLHTTRERYVLLRDAVRVRYESLSLSLQIHLTQ